MRSWEHKPDVELPAGVLEANGVDKVVEKTCHTAEPLEEGYSFCTDVEWEELHEEGWKNSQVAIESRAR